MKRVLLLLAVALVGLAAGFEDEYDYTYGVYGEEFEYDGGNMGASVQAVVHGGAMVEDHGERVEVPLCCPEGEIFVLHSCRPSTGNKAWKPYLLSQPYASYFYDHGRPHCGLKHQAVIRQEEVTLLGSGMQLQPFIQLEPVTEFCVTRYEERMNSNNNATPVTMVMTCLPSATTPPSGPLVLTLCSVALLLLLLTFVAHCVLPKLRELQGHYQIFVVLSLLLYDTMTYPVSVLDLSAGAVACTVLTAFKYFFFVSFLTWMTIICVDVARMLHSRACECSTKRYIIYNVVGWLLTCLVTAGVVSWRMVSKPLKEKPVCAIGLKLEWSLILYEGALLMVNFVLLVFASVKLRGARLDHTRELKPEHAGKCVRLAWSLWFIYLFHLMFDVVVNKQMEPVIYYWQFLVLEALAIFALLVYNRQCVWGRVRGRLFGSPASRDPSARYSAADSVTNEKAQLALA